MIVRGGCVGCGVWGIVGGGGGLRGIEREEGKGGVDMGGGREWTWVGWGEGLSDDSVGD